MIGSSVELDVSWNYYEMAFGYMTLCNNIFGYWSLVTLAPEIEYLSLSALVDPNCTRVEG